MKKGKFIAIDGLDGAGKTTELKFLQKEYPHAVFTKEPGGTPRAEKIRKTLLTHEEGVRDVMTDFFLFWAARAAHMEDVIVPALDKGKVVISDRFDSSTFALQLYGEERQDLEEVFWAARREVVGTYEPDAYIVLDMSPEKALARRRADKSKALTRFDKREVAYHKRVREGFKKFKPGANVYFIDADRSPEEVHKDVARVMKRILG